MVCFSNVFIVCAHELLYFLCLIIFEKILFFPLFHFSFNEKSYNCCFMFLGMRILSNNQKMVGIFVNCWIFPQFILICFLKIWIVYVHGSLVWFFTWFDDFLEDFIFLSIFHFLFFTIVFHLGKNGFRNESSTARCQAGRSEAKIGGASWSVFRL